MARIKMKQSKITFKEGCELYLLDCRQRNLRDGTIRHYRQSFKRFQRYFDEDMPIEKIDLDMYNTYVVQLCDELENSVSVNSYLRDLITVLHFWMDKGYIMRFKMRSIKVDQRSIETYTDEELAILLKKPEIRKCGFIEYECWVMTNFLFSTGVRQRSLSFIQIKDLDLENRIVTLRVTKNRKVLVVPLSSTMCMILQEYLKHRQHKSKEDYLFCNAYGEQLCKSTGYKMLYYYNKGRGIHQTGIHRYRHTFAKQWVLNGGNVVTLSRILGHIRKEFDKTNKAYFEELQAELGDEFEKYRDIFMTPEEIDYIEKHHSGSILLMDASSLGSKVKIDDNQRTVLSDKEISQIISVFNAGKSVEGFCIAVSEEQIASKKYSFSGGQYFDIKIEYSQLTSTEFEDKMNSIQRRLVDLFAEGHTLEQEIQRQLGRVKYEK